MKRAFELKREALDSLSGKWKTAIFATIFVMILGFGSLGTALLQYVDFYEFFKLDAPTGGFFPPVSGGLYSLYLVGMVIFWVPALFGYVFVVGYTRFTLNLLDDKGAKWEDVSSELPRYGRSFAANILVMVYTLLWTLLFIIPGIIASISYALVPFILAEHPKMGASEAIALSKKMMKGYKLNYVYVTLSFFGWAILAIITLGLGVIPLQPYMSTTLAGFYRDVRRAYEEEEQKRRITYD